MGYILFVTARNRSDNPAIRATIPMAYNIHLGIFANNDVDVVEGTIPSSPEFPAGRFEVTVSATGVSTVVVGTGVRTLNVVELVVTPGVEVITGVMVVFVPVTELVTDTPPGFTTS